MKKTNKISKVKKKEKKVIGWREWVVLPDFDSKEIKVKVDTGARTASLHAVNLEIYKKRGADYANFIIYPNQDDKKNPVKCDLKVVEFRKVKSSNGLTEERPVILTNVKLLGEVWPIEITLTNRDVMGFRMLLGRASIRGKFLVDAGKSFYSKKIKNKK